MTSSPPSTPALPFLPPRLARDAVVRSIFIWIGVRGLYAFAVMQSGEVADDIDPLPMLGPLAGAIVIAFVWILVRIDARVCRESVLIANLGVRLGTIQMIAAGVASSLEVAINLLALAQAW
jgi:hypothetical protein